MSSLRETDHLTTRDAGVTMYAFGIEEHRSSGSGVNQGNIYSLHIRNGSGGGLQALFKFRKIAE